MADVRNYTVNYNVTSDSAQAKTDLTQFVEKLEAGSRAAKSMAASMRDVAAAQKAFAQNFSKGLDLRGPMQQMEAFQASAANMIRNISKSFTAMASGNASELEKALGKLTTQGFTKVSKDWNKMTGNVRSEMKETGKVLTEHEKAIKTSMRNIASAYELLAKEGQLGVMSETGRKRVFSKDARALYADLKERNLLTKKGIEGYINEQNAILGKAQEKVTTERLRTAKAVSESMGAVFQDSKSYTRGLSLTGNFTEQADQFRKAVNSISRLSKLSGITDKNKFNIALKVTGAEAAERQINKIGVALDNVKKKANIQVKVSTKGASKNFTQGVRDLRGMLTQANRVINSVAAGDVSGLMKIPAIAEVVGTQKGAKPVPIEGVIEKVVNAAKKVAGEVPVDGIVEFVKGAKKVAGEVGVNGIVEFVKGAKAVLGEVGVEGIVTAAKNAQGFLAKVNAEAVITNATPGKGMKAVPLEVTPKISKPESVAKSISSKPIPVTLRPEWKKDKDGKTALDKWKTRIPPIDLQLNTESAKAKFDEFLAHIRRFKEININLNARANAKYTTPQNGGTTVQPATQGAGGTTTQGTAGRRPPRANREMQGTRKQIMRSSAYPLVGNTSFGVQTPAFVSMAKGMVGMMGIGAAFGLISDAMSQAVEYQNTMMSVKAILESNKRYTGYTPDNFKAMEKNIRRVGMNTKFTAPEVAGAARFMAMAGLSVDQINNSIRPIADVALIGDNDLETTADKITNIQTAFKLGKDKNSMRKLADNLTTTFTRFNTDMMMTAEAMQYAAPVASAAGLGIEDTLAMIGVMGNAGIQASMAGTTLRMAMQNIIKPNKNQKKLWDKLGISRHNADGSPRNIVDVLTELRSKASDAELMETVSNLFRTTSMAGTVQIIRNLDLLKSAREDMMMGRDSGLSEKLSYEKQNTIKGLWAQVTSAFTEDNVLMFEKFQNSLKSMLISVRDYLKTPEAVQNLEHIMELIKTMGSAFGTVVRLWMELYNTFPGAVKAMMVLQFAMSQIGMLLNPFIGLFRVARNMGNFFGITAAAGGAVSGGAGVAGIVGANVMSRYASRYGTMAALGKGFLRSFTAAKSFGALSSLTGIAGMGMSGLGALLGTLLNPITLSLAGIAGSVYLIQKTTSDKKQLQDKSAMSLKSQQKQLDDISSKKLDEKYFNTFDQFARPYINGYGKEKAISVFDRLRGVNRQFTTRRSAHKKLGALESSELLFSDPGWTTTNIEYNRELINSYIKPISTNSVLGSVLAPYIDKDINSSYGHQGNYRKIAGIASIIREGGTSSLVGKYRDRIVDIISKAAFSNDPNAMQNAISRSKALIETFRQTGLKTATLNAKNMSIDDMGNYAPIRFTQYWDAGTAMLEDLVNNKRNKYLKQVYALSEHADITVMGAEEWIKNVDDILSSVAVNIDGKLMTLDFKNGSPIFDELIKKCKDLGMSFTDSLNARLMILQDISDTLNNIPGAKDALMTLQQLIDRLNVLKELGPNEFVKKYYGIDIKDSLGDAFHKVEKKDVEIPLKSENEDPLVMYKWGEEKKQQWGWATHDPISETLQKIEKNTNQEKIESKMNDITNPGGKTTGGSGNPKPSDYTVDQSGYGNHYQRSAARPTQIVLNVDKLVNIDKTEINSMEDRELVSKLEFIVSQAATQLAATAAAQISALGSATGDTQDIG